MSRHDKAHTQCHVSPGEILHSRENNTRAFYPVTLREFCVETRKKGEVKENNAL